MSDSLLRSTPDQRRRPWQIAQVLVIGGATVVAVAVILSAPIGLAGNNLILAVGDVTSADIIAPRSTTFLSQAQTEAARAAAAAAVADIYDPPDSRKTRQQVAQAQKTLDYIGSVRSDAFATRDQKVADLSAVKDPPLDPPLAQQLLELTDAEWVAVRAETVAVIERVMSSRIRPDRVQEALNQLPALVSVSLPEAQADLVAVLAAPFIAPNSFFNEAATNADRQAAREAVAPISQSFVQGQTVVSRGRVVTEADIEALTALGLLWPAMQWQIYLSNILVVLLTAIIFILYLRRFNRRFFSSIRLMVFISILLILFLVIARFLIAVNPLLPFLFPSAAFALLVVVTLGANAAVDLSILLAALVGAIAGGRLDLTAYAAVGGIVAALALGKAEQVNSFFRAGLISAATNAAVILIFQLVEPTTDPIGVIILILLSVLNGIISAALTLVGFFILGNLFGIHTPLQLIELARPNHPLLQYLLRQAPGTYQHSLQVANLAEQAAERIGADVILIRVGALFHDVGKANQPQYFVENQIEGQNPHNELPPELSAKLIIEHVGNGLKMAAKHRLPRVIRDCIAEHHGTNMTYFQYQRAVKAAGGDESRVDKSRFYYPGPKPQTKETALLMLADGCEAKSRADRPRTEEEIEKIVKYIIDRTLAANQLDECELTLHDLKLIRESFNETLKSFFHSRITYPEEKLPEVSIEEIAMRR